MCFRLVFRPKRTYITPIAIPGASSEPALRESETETMGDPARNGRCVKVHMIMDCGFYLYTSDSMEKLAAQYVAAKRKDPELFRPKNLFAVEEIIVPSGGMRQWLKRCLADQGFILSNVLFSSPPAFFDRLFRETEMAFDRDALTWRIVSILKNAGPEDFEALSAKELSTYMEGGKKEESPDLRRFGLANKIASLFEEYLTECPEMLSRWNNNREANLSWQARLWQRLCAGTTGEKTFSPAEQFTALLDGDFSVVAESVSQPVTVWGCSTMPLRQLAILKKLSAAVPVHFFCLNPCDSLWKDELRKRWSDGERIGEPEEVERLYEKTLLRQWSNHERTFFKYLIGVEELDCCKGKRLAGQRVWQSSEEAANVSGRRRGRRPRSLRNAPVPAGHSPGPESMLRGGDRRVRNG